MMERWQITIEAWPHSTGNTREKDQEAAGERLQSYYVDAENIKEAVRIGGYISEAMQSNPAVWRAPITAIMRVKS